MSDIAFKVIAGNGYDDIIFKTIMIKGNTGTSIDRIEKTSTSGNVDTYTVYLTDGSIAGTFTVTNSDASSLSNLTDVDLTSASDGQALVYDATSGKWKNATISMPAESSQGNIASFNTNVAGSLYECIAQITAQQAGSGTPSPTNMREISGFTGANINVAGKNLINITDCLNDYYVKSSDLSVSSIAGANVFYCDVPKNTDLVLTPDKSNRCVILGYKTRPTTIAGSVGDELIVDSPVGITSRSFNTGNNQFLAIYINRDSANKPTQIMLEVGTVASAYQAYNSTTTKISWQTEAGTVYGALLDVLNGILTVTHFGKLITDTDSILDASSATVGFRARLEISSNLIPPADNQQGYDDQKSNVATYVGNAGSIGSNLGTNSFKTHTNGNIYFYLAGYNTLSDLKTYAQDKITANTPISFVWRLATPIIYDLNNKNDIKTLFGNNNIFADTGTIDLRYNQIKFAS